MMELCAIGSVRARPPNPEDAPPVIKKSGDSLEETILRDEARLEALSMRSGFPRWKVEYYLRLSQSGYRKSAELRLGENLATGEPVK